MKPEWLDRSTFQSPVYYSLCTTEEMFYKEMKRCGIKQQNAGSWISSPHSDATAHQFTISESGRACCIVCIGTKEGRTGIEVAGLLVHEATHIWQQICQNIGEHEPSAEFEAYSIQRISQNLMWEYQRQTEKL